MIWLIYYTITDDYGTVIESLVSSLAVESYSQSVSETTSTVQVNVPTAFFTCAQRDAHDFMRFLFYFWSFAKIADIYFLSLMYDVIS